VQLRRYGTVVSAVLLSVATLTVASGVSVARASSPRAAAVLPHWGNSPPPAIDRQGPDPEHPGPSGGSTPHLVGGHATTTSTNWAGQFQTGTTFTEVTARWTVPSVVPSESEQAASTWVGVDGFDNADLIQTGTTEQTSGGGTSYFAWYEVLPAASIPIGAVDPGDQMSAVIEEVAVGTWYLSISDVTAGESSSGDLSYGGPADSVEWIQEDPSTDLQGDLYPLADFGSVTFYGQTFAGSDTAATDTNNIDMVNSGGATVAYVSASSAGESTVRYGAPPAPPTPAPTPTPPTPVSSGYDLVGDDGGVFVFGGGFYGSLPGLGVHVADIVGIVPSSDERGYFLVGADGGVFSFGDTTYEGSLPGLGVHVDDIAGIVPTSDDKGYFLVGRDGGVFAFGDAPFENSLPGLGIHVDDIVGIAATASDLGYWVVGSNGSVYSLGDAPYLGAAGPDTVAIAATSDGGGYWVVSGNGTVYNFGDARNFASVPDDAVVNNVIGIVPSSDNLGYNIFGSDGGVFSFGDAVYRGSLPFLGVDVDDIVGAVPT